MEWLSIEDYAAKYEISVSTVRRRLYGKQIKVKMHRGKYLVENSKHNLGQMSLYNRNKKALFRECPLCGR